MPNRTDLIGPSKQLRRRTLALHGGLLGGLSLVLLACSPQANGEPDEVEEADIESLDSALITRVQGATIASANVDKTKTYLSVRGIDTLETLGALPGALGTLARRVDGVIGSKPADGRFSITEILRMEQPSYIRTLFPEERAALPALWALLETTPLDPTPVNVASLPTFSPVDVSTPATMPIKPPKLEIPTLPAGLQMDARRLEMVVNSDGDVNTITEADIDDPLNDPDPWTADEIDSFKAIKQLFIARAGTTLSYAVNVPAPFSGRSTVATFGTATLEVEQSMRYLESRSLTLFSGDSGPLDTSLVAQRSLRTNLNLPPGQRVVFLDVNSETERLVGGEVQWEFSGTVVAEVWTGSTRTGSYRISVPKITTVDERIDMKNYLDYQLLVAGKPLVKNVTSAAATRPGAGYYQYTAAFTFDLGIVSPPTFVDYTALSRLVTPKSGLMPGRYEISVMGLGTGTCRLEISPEGIVTFTRPGGTPVRAGMYVWTYTKFDAQYPDRLRGLFDPKDSSLTVFFDGRGTLFSGKITDANRTG